jgi:uncharacterized spore protein YtfJ
MWVDRYHGLTAKAKLKLGTSLTYSPVEVGAGPAAGPATAKSPAAADDAKDAAAGGGLALAPAALIVIEDVDVAFDDHDAG